MNKMDISKIRIDGGTQSRVALNEDAVADYAAAIREGAEFPPVVVFHDGAAHWLADGFHRFHAYRTAGAAEIPADIRPGTQRDAILHSVGANAAHGLRRTNADKRRCVETLLKDAEWVGWSDHEIARRCGVSQPFVSGLRGEATNNGFQSPIDRKGADGRTINTANIGAKPKAQPEPKPEPQVDRSPPQTSSVAGDSSDSTFDRSPLPEPAAPAPKPAKPSELEAENERLKAQVATLQEALAEVTHIAEELQAELGSLTKILDAGDREAAWHAEIKRLTHALEAETSRKNGLMNEKNEYVRLTKSWKAKAERLEKEIQKLSTERF